MLTRSIVVYLVKFAQRREQFEGTFEVAYCINSCKLFLKVCLIKFSVRDTIINARTADKRDRCAIRVDIAKIIKILRQNIASSTCR